MRDSFLNKINTSEDVKTLNIKDLSQLASEIRQFIIDVVSVKQGHLGASLGTVELAIALHYSFNTPNDLLIWDVGHQAYGHKILTGRKDLFHTNRQLGGLCGFPKMTESPYDAFGTGHSSTSISAALGMAIASKLKGDDKRHHIAVIGDASLVSGMAFEALNHGGATDTNLWVILNDNAMGIDPSVGALKDYFIQLNSSQNPLIESFNFTCEGVIDGHNIPELLKAIQKLKLVKGPKFLHIRTVKGKGLREAEENQVLYHAPGYFDKSTGILTTSPGDRLTKLPKYQDVFGKTLVELAKKNKKIVGVTPAMPTGTSLKYMMQEFPDRAFDVGIAEQHAITFCAGLATQGFRPYCAIYSTFLQRAYDQLIHDVALQRLPVVFCIDRSGIVGQDGATHHGVYDLAISRSIPDVYIYAPRDEIALRNILYTSQLELDRPLLIRYPRGRGVVLNWKQPFEKIRLGRGTLLHKGSSQVAVISIGNMDQNVKQAIDLTASSITHIDIGFLKPLDEDLLHHVFKTHTNIVTVEDGTLKGGLGSAISEFSCQNRYKNDITTLGIPDKFIPHGVTEDLQDICGISIKKILNTIMTKI